MEKTLTFFRVFDLAFFAPGTILLFGISAIYVDPTTFSISVQPAQLTILVLGVIASAFSLGLVTHSVVWFSKGIIIWMARAGSPLLEKVSFRKANGSGARSSNEGGEERPPVPFPLRFDDSGTRTDLILYFWYLRATTWNIACALLMIVASTFYSSELVQESVRCHIPVVRTVLFFAALALIHQGIVFHRTLRGSFEALRKGSKPSEETTSSGDQDSGQE